MFKHVHIFLLLNSALVYPQGKDFEPSLLTRLSDTSQMIRDNAAAKIRLMVEEGKNTIGPHHIEQHKKRYWDSLMSKVHIGMPMKKALKLIGIEKPEAIGWFACGGGSCQGVYRLDNTFAWSYAHSSDKDQKIICQNLIPLVREVPVLPPAKFSGTWITYFVNGRKCGEIHYFEGKYNGKFITYHDNGQINLIQDYRNGISEGEDKAYYANGQLMYKGVYIHSKQEGLWIHYYENGRVHCKYNYVKGVQEGEGAEWYKNGKMMNKYISHHGKRVYDKAWNEKGELQYEHDWRKKSEL